MNSSIHIAIPRDSSPDVHRAIQQINEGFKQLSIPWFLEYESVQGMKAGRQSYFKHEDDRWCKYIKLEDGLYCIELQKENTSIAQMIDEKLKMLEQALTERLDDLEGRLSHIESGIGTVDIVDLERRVGELENE